MKRRIPSLHSERGATLIEYCCMVSVIAVVAMVSVRSVGFQASWSIGAAGEGIAVATNRLEVTAMTTTDGGTAGTIQYSPPTRLGKDDEDTLQATPVGGQP